MPNKGLGGMLAIVGPKYDGELIRRILDIMRTDLKETMTVVTGLPSSVATGNAPYVTMALDSDLTAERVLTGTATRLSVTDNGANSTVVLDVVSTPLLDANVHSDTVAQGVTRGSLIYGNSTPKWDELVHPAQASRILTTDATDVAWSAFQFTGLANPSASVILTAVNGTATTAMRSDGAPALSQAISPSWTGTHTWASATGLIRVTQAASAYNPVVMVGRATTSGDGIDGTGDDDLLRARDNGDNRHVRIDANGSFICDQGVYGSPGFLGFAFSGGQFEMHADTHGASGIYWRAVDAPTVEGIFKLGPSISASRTWELPNATGTIPVWGAAGTNGDMPLAGALLHGAAVSSPLTSLAIGTAGQILTVNAGATAPQWSTNAAVVDIARTWATLQTFKDTTFKVVDATTASNTLVFDLPTAGTNLDLTLLWAGTADRTVTIPDATCALAGYNTAQTWTAIQTIDADVGAGSGARLDINHDASAGDHCIRLFDNISGFYASIRAGSGMAANRNFIFPPSVAGTIVVGTSVTANRIAVITTANQITTDANIQWTGNNTLEVDNLKVPVGGTTVSSLDHGVYTPTITNVANLAASTAYQCQYVRVGTVVTVSGKVDIDVTAAVATQVGISLPIASNIGANEDLGGTASSAATLTESAAILGDATNDRAEMQFVAINITNRSWYFQFSYRVI